LKKPKKTPAELREALALMRQSKAPERIMAVAVGIVDSGVGRLSALPESSHKRSLAQLADYVTKRQR